MPTDPNDHYLISSLSHDRGISRRTERVIAKTERAASATRNFIVGILALAYAVTWIMVGVGGLLGHFADATFETLNLAYVAGVAGGFAYYFTKRR